MFHFALFIKVQIILCNRAQIHCVNVGESPPTTRMVKTLKLTGKIRLKIKCLGNLDRQYTIKYTAIHKTHGNRNCLILYRRTFTVVWCMCEIEGTSGLVLLSPSSKKKICDHVRIKV